MACKFFHEGYRKHCSSLHMFFLPLKMQYCQQTQQQTRTLLFQVLPKGMNHRIKRELVIERLGGFRWQFSLFLWCICLCGVWWTFPSKTVNLWDYTAAYLLTAAAIDMYVHSVLVVQDPTLALPLVEVDY